jgi:hypothetical protein
MKLRLRLSSIGVVAGGLLIAAAAGAQTPGINLSWDDCGTAGVGDKTRANCTASNTGTQTFYASFVAPGGITALNSAEIYLGIVTAGPLTAWWDIGVPPACRAANSLQMDYISACGTGLDYWSSIPNGPIGSSNYTKDPARNANQVPGANHASFRGVVAVDATQAGPISQGTEVYLCTVNLRNTASTTCAGCDQPACFLFVNLNMEQSFGGANIQLFGPPTGGRDFVTWQGGAGAPCAEVPIRNQTWGQVKSLYR